VVPDIVADHDIANLQRSNGPSVRHAASLVLLSIAFAGLNAAWIQRDQELQPQSHDNTSDTCKSHRGRIAAVPCAGASTVRRQLQGFILAREGVM